MMFKLSTILLNGLAILKYILPDSNIGFILLLFLAVFIYWIFYVPFNWTKHIDDVGYELVLKNSSKQTTRSAVKRDAINRIRRQRKIGFNEMPPPYPNGWYGILESCRLKLGDVTNVSCLGEQLVVFRTQNSEVFVLDAYCPHLGANLGVGGRVVGQNIECPFHQWSFRGTDGLCTSVPYSNCAPHGLKLRKWISCEINDFIFVWYHAESDEVPWKIPIVKEIEKKEYVFHGRNEFYVNCHIQEIPENGADLAHFKAIHTESIFAGGTDLKFSLLSQAGNHKWKAEWTPSQGENKHLASVSLKHSIELTKKFHCLHMDVTGQQVGPSYVRLHMVLPTFGCFEVLQTITPIEPLVQKVVHRFYARRILAPIMKLTVFGESVMFERDMLMWNHKTYRSHPQLVKEDAPLKLFRKWYSQFYTENSKTYLEARNRLDW